jgi:hypothetical protein
MTEDRIVKSLMRAYDRNNLEEFKNILRSTELNMRAVARCLLVVEDGDFTFYKFIVRHHSPTVLNADDVEEFLCDFKNDDDDEMMEMLEYLIPRIPDMRNDTSYELIHAAANPWKRQRPKLLAKTLSLLKDHPLSHEDLSRLLLSSLTSYIRYLARDDENPIAFIKAFVDGGVDISSFHDVLPRYLHYAHKIHPGITDELMKYGIPKSAAYVAKYLKSARYRERLTNL